MTVYELIQELSKADADMEVVVRCYGNEGTSIQNIDDVIVDWGGVNGGVYLTIDADKVLEDFEK